MTRLVTSFEISKKLNEIGFVANSEFFWINPKETIPYCVHNFQIKETSLPDYFARYKAYDLAVILEKLPQKINNNGINYYFGNVSRYLIRYEVPHWRGPEVLEISKIDGECLADMAARMYIELYNRKLI